MTAIAVHRRRVDRSELCGLDFRLFEQWRYLQGRADQKLTKAGFCADALVADVHRELALLYQARAQDLATPGQRTLKAATSGLGEEVQQSDDRLGN